MLDVLHRRAARPAGIVLFAAVLAAGSATAATDLSPGDIVITGVNADNPDQFVFIPLVDLDAGTEITFTDSGVLSDGTSFRANEGAVRYTAPGVIAAGTAISFEGVGGDFASANDAFVGNNGFNLSVSGDQVIAFQGASDAPEFIFAVQTNSTLWQSEAANSNTSALPSGLTDGATAVAVGFGPGDFDEWDNADYMGITSGSAEALRNAVGDSLNWVGDNSRLDLDTNGFTIGGADPTGPSIVSSAPAAGESDVAVGIGSMTVEFDDLGGFTQDWTLVCETVSVGLIAGYAATDNTVTLTLNTLPDGEACTLTIPAGSVRDSGDVGNGSPLTVGFSTELLLALTPIYDVQGPGDTSPVAGDMVLVQGIVTGDFQDGDGDTQRDLRGFFLQDPMGDGDEATSDGIFVFDGDAPAVDVQVGDLVSVQGVATEFFGETQIAATTVTVTSAGEVVDVTTLATTIGLPQAMVLENADGDLIPDLERYEGMLATFAEPLTVNEMFNLDRFGELTAVLGARPVQFTQDNAPDTLGYQAHLEQVAARTIRIDDGSDEQNPLNIIYPNGSLATSDAFRMGSSVTSLMGNVSFRRGSGGSGDQDYRLQPSPEFPLFDTSPNPRPVAPVVDGTLKVVAFNVLNYFTTIDDGLDACGNPRGSQGCRGADDLTGFTSTQPPADTEPFAEFTRQTQKLITALAELDADVLGLVELENWFELDNAFVDMPIETIVTELNLATGRAYQAVDPGANFVGGDAIAVGFIYDSAAVSPVGAAAVLDTEAFIDPNDTTDAGRNRAALAQTFAELASGETFTAVINHFKSKGPSGLDGAAECQSPAPTNPDCDLGDGQGYWNSTRTGAALALLSWLATDPTGSGDTDFLILGDLNAYAQEDPVKAIIAGADGVPATADDYTDLAERFIGADAYSFVFDGQMGSLDHALASPTLNAQVSDAAEWHINADEPDAYDYNMDFGRSGAIFDGTVPARASDHDPIIIGLNLGTGDVTPIPGDLNGDGVVDLVDYQDFLSVLRQPATASPLADEADYNGNGVVDFGDFAIWRGYFLAAQD